MEKLEDAIHKFEDKLNELDMIEKINMEEAANYNKVPEASQIIYKKDASKLGKLENEFYNLALCLIYGGRIVVRDCNNEEAYTISIDSVEFYFHCEGECKPNKLNVKDYIMYHRNGKYGIENVPYLPIMSLYAHQSGYDITFENIDSEYRASALIREYSVKDKDGNYIFRKEKVMKKGNTTEVNKEIKNDDRSTYLYDLLNGFSLISKNNIQWEDIPFDNTDNVALKVACRKNVPKYNDEGEKIPKTKDPRRWQYSRVEN